MTVSIALYGPNAGAAVLQVLATAEKLCSGAIGGFVAAAAVFPDHIVLAETQTGGVAQLQFSTNRQAFESACIAGLISSGPNRPEPLSSFVSAAPGVGVVTGHRMPNAPGRDGQPMNRTVLQLLAEGMTPQSAVSQVVNANPQADCGLIAVNVQGLGHAANTDAVTRADAGMASGSRGDASVWVLHNAVRPFESLAPVLVEVGLDVMQPWFRECGKVLFNKGCLIEAGESPQIHINEQYQVENIVARQSNSNEVIRPLDIGCQPQVLLNGKPFASLLYEPLLMAQGNKLLSADGEVKLQAAVGVASTRKKQP